MHGFRTLQTAVGVFGGGGYTDRTDLLPLMVANAGNSSRAAISSMNCPPIVAVELCREHLGVHPCDKRRSISEYQLLFPAIDFSMIDSNEDIWWKSNVRETRKNLQPEAEVHELEIAMKCDMIHFMIFPASHPLDHRLSQFET
ncbi:hypothetical protein SESBI_32485 [Sesbania bispinosa]|nr:hypothetical protein SESBI_32485 [Sesbania bispinosa]